jgi:hypothetical protein
MEDEGGARMLVREERGRSGGPVEGHWASWPLGRCRGEGRWVVAWSKTGDGPKYKNNFFTNFN